MNGQFLPRKKPAKTVKGRGFLDRGLMNLSSMLQTPKYSRMNRIRLTNVLTAIPLRK